METKGPYEKAVDYIEDRRTEDEDIEMCAAIRTHVAELERERDGYLAEIARLHGHYKDACDKMFALEDRIEASPKVWLDPLMGQYHEIVWEGMEEKAKEWRLVYAVPVEELEKVSGG